MAISKSAAIVRTSGRFQKEGRTPKSTTASDEPTSPAPETPRTRKR